MKIAYTLDVAAEDAPVFPKQDCKAFVLEQRVEKRLAAQVVYVPKSVVNIRSALANHLWAGRSMLRNWIEENK